MRASAAMIVSETLRTSTGTRITPYSGSPSAAAATLSAWFLPSGSRRIAFFSLSLMAR